MSRLSDYHSLKICSILLPFTTMELLHFTQTQNRIIIFQNSVFTENKKHSIWLSGLSGLSLK